MRAATTAEPAEGRIVAFGDFTFDRVTQILRRQGAEVPLPPRVLGVLRLLLEHPGDVVTKQALITAVWRDAFVTETSITEAVSVLRQALGDDTQRPTYVQTLHRRGYRFIADVRDWDGPAPASPRDVSAGPPAAADAPLVPAEPEPRLSLLVPWLVTLAAVLTAASAVWRYVDATTPAVPLPVRFTIGLPTGLTVSPSGAPLAISADGALLAFAGCDGPRCAIYLRPLSQPDPTLVAGTTGASAPFFAPDGRTLGFFADGRLQTLALGGGSPVVVADAPDALGAAWLGDGQIVFARARGDGLFVVSPRGAGLRPLTRTAPGEGGHHWPVALPDASAVLFTVSASESQGGQQYGAVASLGTGTWGRLLDDVGALGLVAPGFLVAQRAEGLVAARFDPGARLVQGLPVAVSAPALVDGVPQFAVSAGGTLVVTGEDRRTIHVVLHWAGDLQRLVPAPQPSLPR